jgi:glycerol-3-phosphate dehydrogenase
MAGPTADARRMATLAALAGSTFDAVVVGGGATGLGIALDAALRGHRVALVERADFAQGTSSRSTKLVHGGVRYLAQGEFGLVHEALRERANLLANAPHIVQPLAFVMPAFKLWHLPFYGLGLTAYDLLAGQGGIGKTRWMGPAGVREKFPTVREQGLLGGVSYWDGQFDDARLAIAIARTAEREGAVLANHCEVTALLGDGRALRGVQVRDRESGQAFPVRARCVINATGVWADRLLRDPAEAGALPAARKPLVAPSQGVHLSFDRSLLPSDSAVFWPRTSDGRVLFAIPWLGKTIVGTTDSKREDVQDEPEPLPGEIDYLLRECARFFATPPRRADILSTWVGLRPLVNPPDAAGAQETKSISREHTVLRRADGLVTVTGGKWTTYRSMAQDVLDQCCDAGLLERRGPCRTATTRLVGGEADASGVPARGRLGASAGLHSYGSEAAAVAALPGAQRVLAPGLTEAMVRFAVRHEFARTVDDVLARRSRLLFLDAKAALDCADEVARVVACETSASSRVAEFKSLAARYLAPRS